LLVDIAVVGAGVAGLSCAGLLRESGRAAVLLDKARGVGGRCATRRVDGQPVDHGVVFLHGTDAEFLAALDPEDAPGALPGWPERIHGSGPPCQRDSFLAGGRRTALRQGISAFPKRLAAGLDVRLGSRVVALSPGDRSIAIRTETGPDLSARVVVLALAAEQSRDLVATLPPGFPEVEAAKVLLGGAGTDPCLTVIAGYPLDSEGPEWDIDYPEDSKVLQLISHDSAKRNEPCRLVLVYQARPRWSRERLAAQPEAWTAELLEEAARVVGAWATRPLWHQSHRWRYARVDRGSELAGPMLLTLPGGGRLGLAGEIFWPGGGVQAAWSSGRRLARRILAETEP
jgi:predicted NAD/FAD-dependent oxidoreductase